MGFFRAESVGFEPTCPVKDNCISSAARYDHFDNSPKSADDQRLATAESVCQNITPKGILLWPSGRDTKYKIYGSKAAASQQPHVLPLRHVPGQADLFPEGIYAQALPGSYPGGLQSCGSLPRS